MKGGNNPHGVIGNIITCLVDSCSYSRSNVGFSGVPFYSRDAYSMTAYGFCGKVEMLPQVTITYKLPIAGVRYLLFKFLEDTISKISENPAVRSNVYGSMNTTSYYVRNKFRSCGAAPISTDFGVQPDPASMFCIESKLLFSNAYRMLFYLQLGHHTPAPPNPKNCLSGKSQLPSV